ncbi:MAG: hypothetical protein Q7R65_03655 [bacterium]|nr:hypothetical protein [bacterium]
MEFFFNWSRKFSLVYPRLRIALGVLLILLGLFAFFTPLTPGSWLALIGLELLGLRVIFADKIKKWFSRRG